MPVPLVPRPCWKTPSQSSEHCKRNTVDLPRPLDDAVPTCAEPCLTSYIRQHWTPSPCQNSEDFGCLCSRYSTSGYTLGEIALACVSSSCGQPGPDLISRVYDVCARQSNAATATHTALTILVSPTASTTTSSQTDTGRSQTPRSSLPSRSGFSTVTPTSTSQVIPIITSISDAVTSSSPVADQTGSELTNAQAVGITVGAFGGIGIAAGLIFCCICIRRRKRRKREQKVQHKKRKSLDFACRETPRIGPLQFQPENPQNSQDRSQEQVARPDGAGQGSRRSTQWLVPGAIANTNPSRSASHTSINSDRVVSQLLPDKPTTVLDHTAEKDGRRRERPFSAQTHNTEFEDDSTSWSPGLQKPAPILFDFDFEKHAQSSGTAKLADRPLLSSRRQSGHSWRSTALSLTIPRTDKVKRSGEVDGANANETLSRRFQTPTSASAIQSAGSGMSYLPSYYTSKESRTPVIPLKSPTRPQVRQLQPGFVSPPPQKPLPKVPICNSRLPGRRPSKASETSFEPVDANEVSPLDEGERRLARRGSPIYDLKYPRIPRPASQAVPRSPPISPISPLKWNPRNDPYVMASASTLAPKRSEQNAASDMQQRLTLANGSSWPAPPSGPRKHRDSLLSYETPVKKATVRSGCNRAYVTPPARTSSLAHNGHRPKLLSVFPDTTPTPPRILTRGGGGFCTPSPAAGGPGSNPDKRNEEMFVTPT